MIKKILLWVLIAFVLYGTSVFIFPSFAEKIDTLIGQPGLSEKIRGGKEGFDTTITDIPQVNEFKSGAADIKNIVVEKANEVKENVDTIRSGAQKVQETVEEGKQTYEEAKEVFEDASQKAEKIQGIIQDVKNLSGTGE